MVLVRPTLPLPTPSTTSSLRGEELKDKRFVGADKQPAGTKKKSGLNGTFGQGLVGWLAKTEAPQTKGPNID